MQPHPHCVPAPFREGGYHSDLQQLKNANGPDKFLCVLLEIIQKYAPDDVSGARARVRNLLDECPLTFAHHTYLESIEDPTLIRIIVKYEIARSRTFNYFSKIAESEYRYWAQYIRSTIRSNYIESQYNPTQLLTVSQEIELRNILEVDDNGRPTLHNLRPRGIITAIAHLVPFVDTASNARKTISLQIPDIGVTGPESMPGLFDVIVSIVRTFKPTHALTCHPGIRSRLSEKTGPIFDEFIRSVRVRVFLEFVTKYEMYYDLRTQIVVSELLAR